MGENVKFLRLLWDIVVFRLVAYQGVLGGGLPHYAWPPWGGLFKYYICMHFPSLGNLHSKWNCIALSQTKRLRKEKIYSDSQQYPSKLCLAEHCIKYPCFPIGKLIIFICGFSTKVTHEFLASETMEKWRFQRCIGHATLRVTYIVLKQILQYLTH